MRSTQNASLLLFAAGEADQELLKAQQRDGWYCWGCAQWLPAGKGVIVTRWPKFRHHGLGLYCDKSCAP